MIKSIDSYRGFLVVADPHLESRVPGFRKDDYPRVVLEKVTWCLGYAHRQNLLPVFLGDIFHVPRDNPNWLLGELLVIFQRGVIGVYGNHDVQRNELTGDDSLDVIVKAGKYQLLDEGNPWYGNFCGQPVIIGGTSWGRMLPSQFQPGRHIDPRPVVFWLAHHDVRVPGYEEEGRFDPREIPGVDAIINGHIHRRLEPFQTGSTVWLTPGNIVRRQRSDMTKQHIPSALEVDIHPSGWSYQYVEVPHKPFNEVFYGEIGADARSPSGESTLDSRFIAGLSELLARKTDTAAGLMAFLEINLAQFDEAVAKEIMKLAKEVTTNGE